MPLGSKVSTLGNFVSLGGASGNGSSTGGLSFLEASAACVADFVTPLAPLRNLNNGIKLIPDKADKAMLPAAPK